MNQEALLEQAQKIVDQAKPNEQIEVCCASSTSTKIRVYGGNVESLTQASNDSIGIRILSKGRQGFASTGSFSQAAIDKAFADARDNSEFSETDEDLILAEPDGVEPTQVDTWKESVLQKPTEEKVAIALELEEKALAADKRITGVRVSSYSDGFSQVALASSNGIAVTNRTTQAGAAIQVMSAQDSDTRSGFGFDGGLESAEIDIDVILDRAVNRALNMLGSKQPDSQSVDLYLEPEKAATFFSLIASMLDGESVVKVRTPFANRVDESIAAESLFLYDDATDKDSKAAAAFDGEGLATRRVSLIDAGVLQGFMHDTYSAKRIGSKSTGSALRGVRGLPSPGPQALHVAAGAAGSEEEIISKIKNGVYVYDFAGLHSGVNTISGDLSLGVEGLMIRDGKICESISECTITSTLQRMLLDISAIGSTVKHLHSGVSTPPIVIKDIALSGAS